MALDTSSSPPTILGFGAFEVDLRAGELRKQGKRIKLQHQPFQVLGVLLERPGEVVTREQLRAQIWPQDTFVDFDNSLNTAINKLREALGDSADSPRFIETVPRRGYRFLAPVSRGSEKKSHFSRAGWRLAFSAAAMAIVVASISSVELWRSPQPRRLTDQDTMVLADFVNTTGDPAFDETLKQGLRVQLEQSPFLNVLSDQKVDEELKLMMRSIGERLTPELARDLCQRVSGKAVLKGAISRLGTHYVIDLNLFNCHTGEEFDDEQVEADSREHVLNALSESTLRMRKKLGESRALVQKYDVPLEQATTSSLEALKAYSLGIKTWRENGETAAFPFMERAVELDPQFAMAYARMGVMHGNLLEFGRSLENIRIAHELRERVSERERLYIDSQYYGYVTGELEKALQAYKIRAQIYPRDAGAHNNLANTYSGFGMHEQSLEEALTAMQLDPDMEDNYITLANSYICLSGLNEAKLVLEHAEERKLESEGLVAQRFLIAFLERDDTEMKRLAIDFASKPGIEDALVLPEEMVEAYYGRLRRARATVFASMNSRKQRDLSTNEAVNQATLGVTEAYFGDTRRARVDANQALKLAPQDFFVRIVAALALAVAADAQESADLAHELDKSFPRATDVQRYWMPSIRAAIALNHKNADQAVELLRVATPYDLGTLGLMEPVYQRGQAYLALHDGTLAAAEFRKIIEHPSIVQFNPIGALAFVGLARAYTLQGDTLRGRAAYSDFLTLWKDADPDIPILQQARAEYAKLQ